MGTHRIAAIPGDGIGGEVTAAGLALLEALQSVCPELALSVENFPWGSDYYRANGRMMPVDGLDILRAFDAIYFGAVGDPDIPDHVTLWVTVRDLPTRTQVDTQIQEQLIVELYSK